MRRNIHAAALLFVRECFAGSGAGSLLGYPYYAAVREPARPGGGGRKLFGIRGGTAVASTVQRVQHGAAGFGAKLKHNAAEIQVTIVEGWDKNTANFRRASRRESSLRTDGLDEVVSSFSAVMRGSEIDTAQLLRACRAHLALTKSGGSALKLVAKDMENNLIKAERMQSRNGETLSELLRRERDTGAHNGSELEESSAAMGLLWIRRSIAFQRELLASLLASDGLHPRDAAVAAYGRTLSRYYGWMLSKVFSASISQMPERRSFIAKFGEVTLDRLDEKYEETIVNKLRELISIWDPLVRSWEGEYERLGLEDTRQV